MSKYALDIQKCKVNLFKVILVFYKKMKQYTS